MNSLRRAEIQNTASGKITTSEITSNAETGSISGGEVTATAATSQKHLQLSANFPNLKTTRTNIGAKLLISDRAQVPALSRIENSGNTKILVDAPQLSDLQNTQSGHLQIETH